MFNRIVKYIKNKFFVERINENENTYRSLVELSTHAIIVHQEGKLVFVNPAAVKFLKAKSADEIIGQPVIKFVNAEYHDVVSERIKSVYKKNIIMPKIEEKFIGLDGSQIDVEVIAIPFKYNGKDAVQVEINEITERKKIEEEREKLAALVNSSNDAIFGINIDSIITSWNKGAENLSGYKAEEIIGKPVSIFVPDDRQNESGQILQLLRNKEHINGFETVRLRKDGTRVDMSITISPVMNSYGNVIGASVIARDITEQKRMEKSIRESEERFRVLFDNSPDAYFIMDLNELSRIRACNKAAEIMLKGSKIDIINKTPEEFSPVYQPDGRLTSEDIADKTKLLLKECKLSFERMHKRLNGENFWAHITSSIVNLDGREAAFVSWRDITLRKQFEEQLTFANKEIKKTKKEIEFIIDNFPGYVFLKDTKNNFLIVNKYIANHYSLSKNELSGKSMFELHSREDAQKYFDDDLRIIHNRVPEYNVEHSVNTPKGLRTFLTTKIPVFDDAGEPRGIIHVSLDITEKKAVEAARDALLVKLENKNAELQDFLYIASHDLQEPLRKILGFGSRLSDKYKSSLDEKGLDYINRMQNAANRMSNLLEALLKYSRVTSNIQKFELIDLNEIIKNVLYELELRIEKSAAQISFSNLPFMEADKMQLIHLFQNLISNAIKYRKTDVQLMISIYHEKLSHNELLAYNLDKGKTYYKITVEDNGIGFDQKYEDKIFQIFERLHGRSEYEGTGIGLSLCKKIAERHKGIISAEGNPGKGSRFFIILPEKQT